jgi:hypothetical protein
MFVSFDHDPWIMISRSGLTKTSPETGPTFRTIS